MLSRLITNIFAILLPSGQTSFLSYVSLSGEGDAVTEVTNGQSRQPVQDYREVGSPARLNQQQGAAGVCTDNAAAELRKRLPLQTHAALLEFEKLLETEENMSAIVSGLGFSYSFIFFMKMLIFPFVF